MNTKPMETTMGNTAATEAADLAAMPAAEFERWAAIDQGALMHSWAVQNDYAPQIAMKAEGNYVWDHTGRRYLDFTAQQWHANVGHNHPRVVNAIADAASNLASVSAMATRPRLELADKILSLMPESYSRVYFGSNGSDANETALKTARLITGRQGVISFWNAYHGGSMAATSVTGLAYLRAGFGQPVPGTHLVPGPYHYRSPLAGATQSETEQRTVDFIRQTIEYAGPETIAAVIGEPFNATAGMVPSPTFWRKIRALCDEFGILLIGDEVVAGFGRTGRWFGCDYYDYEPDIVTFAKGMTSGYLPLSAAVFRRNITEQLEGTLWPHGFTYSGNTLCCVAGLANIAVIEEENLVERAAEMGDVLKDGFETLKANHPCVGDVRCIGLYAAIELVQDRATKAAFPDDCRLEADNDKAPGIAVEVANLLKARGILVNAMRVQGIVKVSPPLTITREEVERVVSELDDILTRVDALAAKP